MKQNWIKPQLTVLVRGRPEESVLDACKVPPPSSGPAGTVNTQHGCNQLDGTGTCRPHGGT
jgi:hypothetical protein